MSEWPSGVRNVVTVLNMEKKSMQYLPIELGTTVKILRLRLFPTIIRDVVQSARKSSGASKVT